MCIGYSTEGWAIWGILGRGGGREDEGRPNRDPPPEGRTEGQRPEGTARGGRVEVRGGPNPTRPHAPPEHATMPTPQGFYPILIPGMGPEGKQTVSAIRKNERNS